MNQKNISQYHLIFTVLTRDGWKTADTYTSSFAEPPEKPGVYLILKVDLSQAATNNKNSKILYIGKSKNLFKRLNCHPVIYSLRKSLLEMCSLVIFFKELPEAEITQTEIDLIKKYHPPYNLQHRVKGD